MYNFMLYHPGTGTAIALSDPVYLIDVDGLDPITYSQIENGMTVDERQHKGYRIDNYNMTNFLFGGAR
mgnify:FL=1